MRPVWMSLAAVMTFGILATWLSRGSTVDAHANMARAVQPVHVLSASSHTDVSRLSREMPAPIVWRRDPFVFAARAQAAALARIGHPNASARAIVPTSLPNRDSGPVLALIGIAEEVTDAGLVRTAVLIRPDATVLFVHDGDSVGERVRVVGIEAGAVTITNPESGAPPRRLLLQ